MKRNKKILIAAAVSGMLSAGMLCAAHAADSSADGTQVAAADKTTCKGKNGCTGKNGCKGKNGCSGNGCKGKNGCNGKCDSHTCKGSKGKKTSEPKAQSEAAPVTQEDAAAVAAPAEAPDNDRNIHDDAG